MAPEAADNLVSMCSMCFFQVSLSSRNTPKYFMKLACFILQSFICGKIFSLVLVKNKKLVSFTLSDQRWSPQGRPWPRGRPRGHVCSPWPWPRSLKSLALASKP